MHGKLPNLLLVEDDTELGPLMVEMLNEQYNVHWARSLRAARDANVGTEYAACIIDRRLPDGDGADFIRQLRQSGNETPTLMLTALGTTSDRVLGLDSGANDYLVKPFEFEELFARLRAIRRSTSAMGLPNLPIGDWDFLPTERLVRSPYGDRVTLTEREAALLAVLAREPNRTFRREELLARAFPGQTNPGLIETYVHYLRRRLGAQIISTVHRRGYRIGLPE